MKVFHYTVFQLPVEHPQCFRPLDFNRPLDTEAYQQVYDAVLSSFKDDISKLALCEQIFKHLNADDRPNAQSMRSMSVSDIIAFDDGSTFFCDSYGFKPVVILPKGGWRRG